MELWKKIPYKEFSHVSVSNTGRLRNDNSGDTYTLRLQPKTELTFCDLTCTDDKGRHRKTIYIAHEVAEAFIKKPKDFYDIPYKGMHKKGVSKTSNLVKNIEWVSQSVICKNNMKKATPEVRNKIGEFNKEKWKGHIKKKYVKIADRPNYKPDKKKLMKDSNLRKELEKEQKILNEKLEKIKDLLKLIDK